MKNFLLASLTILVLLFNLEGTKAEYFSITDGDTIRIGNTRYRLAEIDAPESTQEGGKEATNFLKSLTKGKQIHCEPTGETSYNRLIAYCYANNINLNLEMVKSGNAVVYKHYHYTKQFEDAENQAKEHKFGIWNINNFQMPWDYRHSHKGKHINQPFCKLFGDCT